MKDEILHSYPMYVSDWVRSETRIKLSSAGRGMFRELLDYCWIEGTLPNDARALRSISGGTEKEFAAEWPIMEKCFTVEGDRLRHWKVDDKRPELVEKKQQRSAAGVASVKARRERKLNGNSTTVQTTDGTTVQTNTHGLFKPSVSVSLSSSISISEVPQTPIERWVETLCELHPAPCDPRYPTTFCTDNWLRLGEDSERFEAYMQGIHRSLLAWAAHWRLDGDRYALALDKWLAGGGWKKRPPEIVKPETEQERKWREVERLLAEERANGI